METFYDDIIAKGVYFLLGLEDNLACHTAICLAEGFQEMGIPIYANRNYWYLGDSNRYLFNFNKYITVNDCAICIASISNLTGIPSQDHEIVRTIIKPMLDSNINFKILLNITDQIEIFIPELLDLNYVFRSHMNRFIAYPINFVPWPFGVSNRIKNTVGIPAPFSERRREILVNFRPSADQSVRVALEYTLMPWLSYMFTINRTVEHRGANLTIDSDDNLNYTYQQQIGDRHHSSYYQRLKNSIACCTYGGTFIYTNIESNTDFAIARWDSWRLWESLVAGCVAINLDFDKYGFQLPIMPENWKHYVGVDIANPKEIVDKFKENPSLMSSIASEGRKWVLEHYTPVPTACYFLDIILGEPLGTTKNLLDILNVVD